MAGTLPIPVELLPTPRLIIWTGDLEDARDAAALDIISRTFHAAQDHGFAGGRVAGGNDWTGWHLTDPEAIAGLTVVARAAAPPHWRFAS